eukprot:TRINITY_DN76051_c0_g1_i1.p1 TRINITY_DN76051_c0_g1~~TRINITY_DN76051_c0_g1_i1.p1  ORF type:complete len:757 (+),score=224.24 TRINITY_DN76051_c0_g1_i1:78-2348(+)
MGDDDDVAKALAFLRKNDIGPPTTFVSNIDGAGDEEDMLEKRPPEPVGPNWKKPGSSVALPKLPGHPADAWLIHERQEANGRYKAWLFFSTIRGEYYKVKDAGGGFMLMDTPNDPQEVSLNIRVGNATVLSGAGTKLDMAVLLPDLPKTGFLLKQPLEFLDKPASLFILCAGLRNTPAAAEFCAKKHHSILLPKLSAKATPWSDQELKDLLREAVADLDKQLLDSPTCFAGSCFAVALLLGKRLVVGALGNTRCVLCRPGISAGTQKAGASSLNTPWTGRLIAGGDAHTMSNKDERFRVESEDQRLAADAAVDSEAPPLPSLMKLRAGSARAAELAAVADDWEREFVRVSRAANSFATLGVTVEDLQKGADSVRRSFRKRTLLVHPDKVLPDRKKRTTLVFSKLEAAAKAVEEMLQADKSATLLLAQIHFADGEGRLAAEPAAAAKLLGVQEGCGKAKAEKACKAKFDLPLSRLQDHGRRDVEHAMKILGTAVETVARETKLWTPADADEGVKVTRALGCRDLKLPRPLLSSELAVDLVHLLPGEPAGLALVGEGAEQMSNSMIASRIMPHCPGRPRAAAQRIALDARQAAWDRGERPRDCLSIVCAMMGGEPSASSTQGAGPPAAKKLKTGRPERVRMSHVLLRWAGMKGEDEFLRPGMPAPTRTQAEAEKELLELMEVLLAARDPKTLGARFKAEVLKRSECSTATNVPYADLGWIDPGGAEPALEVAAFDTPVGGLSDVVVSTRGAHLMHRLA